MKHVIGCDTSLTDHGVIVGQPFCSCGWTGKHYDVGEPSQRKAYETEAAGHRIQVRLAKCLGCAVVVVGVTWLALMVIGAVALIRWLVGLA